MKKFSYLILLALFGAFFLVSCSDNDKEEPQRDKVDFSKLVGVWKTLNGNDTIEFMYNNTLIQVAPGFKKTGTWTTTSDKKLTMTYNRGVSVKVTVTELNDNYLYFTVDGQSFGYYRISNKPSSGGNTTMQKGTVILVNQSPYNKYEVTFDGLTYTLDAGQSKKITGLESGLYNMSFVQLNGYVSGKAYKGTGTPYLSPGGTVNCKFPELGTVTVVNKDSDPYVVTINGRNFGNVAGNSSMKITTDVGYYSIHVKQASGYLLWASEKTLTGTISDSGVNITATINFY